MSQYDLLAKQIKKMAERQDWMESILLEWDEFFSDAVDAQAGIDALKESRDEFQRKNAEFKISLSPIGQFVSERCNVAEEETVLKSAMYDAWLEWCEDNSVKDVGKMNVFARNLRKVVPSLKPSQPREGNKRLSVYKGVGLKPVGLPDEDWTLGATYAEPAV